MPDETTRHDRRPPSTDGHPEGETTTGHGIDAVPTRHADSAQWIGPYCVIKTIGRGGMGVVYLARDERTDREVALKVIPAGPDADQTDLARFKTEAESVARLDHPNIVRLYDVGDTDHESYLAMEYVDGGTLYRRITRGEPIDPLEAARLLETLARAVDYAHRHDVLHRDLKPSNILLADPEPPTRTMKPRRDDSSRGVTPGLVPKIADFGLAKQLDQSLRLTQTGTAIGTPHYMAPEQARGEKDVGPALDIHGLGAILYETLTGSPPYDGKSPAETMDKVVHQRPTPPRELRPQVPAALEAICLKCLEKQPDDRYRTAADLANDLRRFLDGRYDTTTFVPATGQPKSDRRWIWAAAGIGLAAVGLTMVLTATQVSRAYRKQADELRRDADLGHKTARRAQLEAAIAQCERGQISAGLERMRDLAGDPDLPIPELIAAWEARLLKPHSRQPTIDAAAVAVSTTGDRVAVGSGKSIQLHGVPSWQPQGEAIALDAEVTALAWQADDAALVVGMANGDVVVVPMTTRKPIAPAAAKAVKPISSVAFVDGEVRFLVAGETTARRVTEDKEKEAVVAEATRVVAAAVDPVRGDVAVVGPTGAVRLFDAADRRWRDLPPDADASAVAYSTDGNVLAVGGRNGTVRLWDAVARVPFTEALVLGPGPIEVLAVGGAGKQYVVLAGTRNGPVTALHCGRPFHAPPIRLDDGDGEEVLGVSFSRDPLYLYVTSPAGVSLWRYADGGVYVRELTYAPRGSKWTGPQRVFSSAVQGPADKESLVVGGNARLTAVDANRDRDLATAAMPAVTGVAVGDHGGVCACARTATGSLLRHWPSGLSAAADPDVAFGDHVRHGAFLADGTLALGCENGRIHFWDPIQRRDVRPPLEAGSPVRTLAVSNDGRAILAGCADGSVHAWDRETGDERLVVRHRSEVRGVAFHGTDVLTASADGTLRRWHAATGLPLGPPLHHADAVSALHVSHDRAVTGDRQRFVRTWRLK